MSATEGLGEEDKGKLVSQFREVTGVDGERAKFYLESANWELQPAMGAFFESGGGEVDMDHEDEGASVPIVSNVSTPSGGAVPVAQTAAITGAATAFGQGQPKPRPPAPRGGLMTMDALRNRNAESDSSDDDDKEAFYTGGSISSGQQVLGPSAPKNRDEMIADMFKKAREMGAQEVDPPQMFKRKTNNESSFGGSGHKLGDSVSSSSSSGGAVGTTKADDGEPTVQDVVLHLWSDGFTVDDGPLRSYQDQSNLAFLDSVKRGEVPAELRQKLTGQDCTLSIMDKRGQDYAQPQGSVRAFAGKGQTLGSPTPITVGSTGSSEDDRKVNESAARSNIQLVSESPTTSIQFRLSDGSRLAAQFNHTHTVQDLYNFINTARPEYSSASYILTLFPNVQLINKGSSLKDANVLNSSLIQKMQQ